MNTKTSIENTSNSYDGGNMGRDSPAALLDMLAEVASRTLHSEKKQIKSRLASQCKKKTNFVKRKPQELFFNVAQLLSMPKTQLVKQFSIFTSDELKRQYSYTCALIDECGQKYTSFASENKARMSIKAHLVEHLEQLKTDEHAYNSFTVKSVKCNGSKSVLQHKKNKLQQLKKPQETLNKENKNVITQESTNYLRKILLNDVKFKDFSKQNAQENPADFKNICTSENKGTDHIDIRVLGDHSYYERFKEEIPSSNESSNTEDVLDRTSIQENIVLMVVGTDSVHMKEYSHVKEEVPEDSKYEEPESVYISDISWSKQNDDRNMEIITPAKPKGKAKFIGTSKEEREMALAIMERIKKKGNPTGNNLQCCICDPPRSFTAPTTLVSHYRSHAGIKPYECRICRAVFTRRHSLKYHMLIHQNQTRFTCADCGKKFRHPSHFREHRRRHTGEAPFGCEDCGQRFKTRNTYKRHLKTRHGKLLTTSGELLYLSEEDFQKVRTNKKKKLDCNGMENITDENSIAPNTLTMMDYGSNNDQMQINNNICEQYIIGEDISCNDENWRTKESDECFEEYEVSFESQSNKTEYVETEISMLSKDSNSNEKNMNERSERMQDDLSEIQRVSYDLNLGKNEKDNSEETDMNDRENISEQNQILCSDTNEIRYDNSNIIEYQENIDFLESQINNSIQLLQHNDENFCENSIKIGSTDQRPLYVVNDEGRQIESAEENDVYNNNADEEKYAEVILTQDNIVYEESEGYSHIVDNEVSDGNETYDSNTFVESINLKETTLEVNDKHKTEDICRSKQISENKKLDDYTIEKKAILNNSNELNLKQYVIETVDELAGKISIQNKGNRQLYIHPKPLSRLIMQNKCVSVIPSQANVKNENEKIFNNQIETINLMHNGKQNTILLLSSDSLRKGVLNVNKDQR